MSGHFELTATHRITTGKAANRKMRHASDLTPAVVYGGKKAALNISLQHQHLLKALKVEAFLSHIIILNVDGQPEKVVIKSLQRHPYKTKILHLDFLRVSDTDTITMRVPIHFTGGDVAPGVKRDGGLVSHLLNEIEVKCLPKDLPEFLTVDLSHLELDQFIHLSDLKLPNGVEIPMMSQDNLAVASVHRLRQENLDESAAAPAEAAKAPEKDNAKNK